MNKDAIILLLVLGIISLITLYLRTINRSSKEEEKERGFESEIEKETEKKIEELNEYRVVTCLRQVGVFGDRKFEDVKKMRLVFSDYSAQSPESEADCIYKCPKCGVKYRLHFAHGDVYKCVCGLFAQLHGNTLKIWE